jgi:hypothetical protein
VRDGNRYYKAFPDERSILSSIQALLDALARLEAEFRGIFNRLKYDTAQADPVGPTQDSAGLFLRLLGHVAGQPQGLGTRTQTRNLSRDARPL